MGAERRATISSTPCGLGFWECHCGASELDWQACPRVVDPDFGGDGLQCEADPEGGAEEFCGLWLVTAHQCRGEKRAHNRANRGNGEADGVAANHPLAMLGELPPQRVPQRFAQRNQKECSEQSYGGLFIETANRFSKRQSQSRESYDGACCEKDSPRPAMHLRIARAQTAHELQRPEHHEEHRGKNMRQDQGALACKMRV